VFCLLCLLSNNTHHLDQLLSQAHSMYATKPRDENILRLLHLIHSYHPDHLPTMLLLACVYFAHQNYPLSLRYNLEILKRDPQYVEAMSNIGTTLRGMGRHQEAEMWWWQAIQLRPNYWDAVDNLVGVLCSVGPDGRADPARYREALRVCHFVADNVIGRDGRAVVRAAQIPRLQNVLHVAANLHYQLGELDKARREYERVLCVMFGGLSVETVIAQAMHTFGQPPGSLLLLVPEQAVNLVAAIFPGSDGILPGLASGTNLASSGNAGTGQELTPQQIQQSNQVTATVLLTLAKWHQDAASCPPAVLGVVLPLYYLSLSLHQSPSTCNNLGILLSGIQQTVTDPTTNTVLSGPQLAMRYYTYGLKLDARHAHLYTNLGSLLKDAGQLEQAIQMYERAVCFNPKFDVALANLANAVKDAGRVQDSIQWYRRAVEVNPDFAEAVCGLVNALGGVCDWRGRGGVAVGWSKEPGWMEKVIEIVDKQLNESRSWAAKVLSSNDGRRFLNELCEAWTGGEQDASAVPAWLAAGAMAAEGNGALPCEGGWAIRALEKCLRRIQHRWYLDQYGDPERGVPPRRPNEATAKAAQLYRRPVLPLMAAPPVPTVLPFHTFTYPLSPRQVRLISHRNALRISHNALTANWLPPVVYRPPPPPSPKLRIGYVSSDFNNHPLAHLMQSVFGFHDRNRCVVFCYAITPSDNSPYRAKIEREADVFLDVSSWTTKAIVEQIVNDGIHILVNLNGYTKGARNEIFAARPCPVQVSYMGFAGTLAAGWCDYFIVDPIVCPPDTVACERWRQRPLDHNTRRPVHRPGDCGPDLDPEDETELDWVYSERLIYMPHSYFVNDHRQGFREKDEDIKRIRTLTPEQRWLHEEDRRWKMRREVFPGLDDNVVIFANFNQLYKIDPNIFRVWLRILTRVPNSILWLLRFPAAGEQHILRTAKEECGEEVASRIVFTGKSSAYTHTMIRII
jgi:protein O-GlcNAc transferase